MPYCPVWRGPTVLKRRTMITGSLRSFQYASARNSSIALLHAYAHRCFGVGPRTRSESSRKGTSSLLPYTSEVDAITTSFFFLFACFSTTSVPCTLVSIVWTGCSTISLTPTAAARWKTTSLRSISSASSGSLLTVSMKYSKPDRPFKRAMLSIDPVDRSSRISTSWPWSSNASDRWDPMKPAPPVINARTRDVLSRNRGRRRERVHRLRDRVDVGVVERRIQRQREYLVARARRNRALARIGRRQRRLARNRHGIVNERLDAARREVRLQIRARVRSYDEEMVHVARVLLRYQADGAARERAAVPRRQRAAARGPRRQKRQARAERGGLQFVETRVDAGLLVMIAAGLAAVAQPTQPIGQRAVVGEDRTAVAEGAKVLRGVEAEGARGAEAAHRSSGGGREMRVTTVFDDGQVVARRDGRNRGHVGGLSVEMHRENRARPRSDRVRDAFGIDRQTRRVDVGEDRTRAGHQDRERAVRGGQRRRDHLVARGNAERTEAERERIGPGADPDRVIGAGRGGEFLLERLDLRPEHEPSALDHAVDGASHRRRVLARRERQEWNPPRGHATSGPASAPMYCPRWSR